MPRKNNRRCNSKGGPKTPPGKRRTKWTPMNPGAKRGKNQMVATSG